MRFFFFFVKEISYLVEVILSFFIVRLTERHKIFNLKSDTVSSQRRMYHFQLLLIYRL